MRPIYTALNEAAAKTALENLRRDSGRKDPGMVAAWERAWDNFVPFLEFDSAIRKVIYTTNAIESVNFQLRKITKNRGHLPSDEAAIKLLYLGIRNVTGRHIDGDGLVLERGQRGTGTLGWKAAMNAFAVTFPNRVPYLTRRRKLLVLNNKRTTTASVYTENLTSSHIRRYFVRAGDANPAQLKYWTQAWLDRIRDLYRAHDELTAAWQEAAAPAPQQEAAAAARLEKAGRAWDGALAVIDETRKKQAQAPGLAEPAKKALATLDREWDGLAAHRSYPMVSLDNNVAERAIRGPVVTRKNARGSHNGDTARNAAVIWTVTATARMAGLNELTYLTACLDECGRNGGKPLSGPALERFLPWNASPEDLRTWAQPPPDG